MTNINKYIHLESSLISGFQYKPIETNVKEVEPKLTKEEILAKRKNEPFVKGFARSLGKVTATGIPVVRNMKAINQP